MLTIEIPGRSPLCLEHLVLDYNGTLAVDGILLPGVPERLSGLARHLLVHVLTADTYAGAAAHLAGLPCTLTVLPPGAQDQGKLQAVQGLGLEHVVCIGNGYNDRLMLDQAVLGIAVILGEGASGPALRAADVVCTDILDALDLLQRPQRLVATLRC